MPPAALPGRGRGGLRRGRRPAESPAAGPPAGRPAAGQAAAGRAAKSLAYPLLTAPLAPGQDGALESGVRRVAAGPLPAGQAGAPPAMAGRARRRLNRFVLALACLARISSSEIGRAHV